MTQERNSITSCGRLMLMILLLIMQFSKITCANQAVQTETEHIEEKQTEQDSRNVSYTYTIWIGSTITEAFTLSLVSPVNTNFYNAMIQAAEIDPRYAFECEDGSYGHYVTTIDGKKADSENDIYWMLYHLPELPNPSKQPDKDQLTKVGVDGVIVQNGENYLFWYQKVEIPV